MLRLVPIDTSAETITIERATDNERDIWTIADDRLGVGALATDYRIRQAKLAIRHRAGGSNRRQTLQITFTHPYKSNIKDQREIERLVASKYLPRWGLLVG